ncbi:hypothetical protein [Niallia sp. 01092]|uniref:hypothetical protein n=1 Tax=unclassified Niallia TaxID=2837522 RepID=UPI003FD3D651
MTSQNKPSPLPQAAPQAVQQAQQAVEQASRQQQKQQGQQAIGQARNAAGTVGSTTCPKAAVKRPNFGTSRIAAGCSAGTTEIAASTGFRNGFSES